MEILRPMNEPSLFPADQQKVITAINKIRGKGGESYAKRGLSEMARRNPVKEDTAPLLTALARMKKPETILELGTAYGYSALHLALGAPLASLFTVEYEEDVAEEAKALFKEAGVIAIVLTGDAGDIVTTWPRENPVDLFFVDHDKKQYLPHFQGIERHLAPDALIVADNVNDRRSECGDFVEYVLARYNGQIMPTEAGLLVAQGRIA